MNNQRIITEILTQLQQGLSQSRNKPGELYGEEYQRNIQTLKDTHSVKYAEAASKVKTDDELNDAVDDYILKLATQLEKSGMSYTDAFNKASEEGAKFKDVITRQNEEFKKNLNEFETKFSEDIQKYEDKLDKRAYNNVTNGRSGQIDTFGERLDGFGTSISRLSSKLSSKKGLGSIASIAGKAGGALSKFGGLLSKFAGPIGMLINVINTAGELWKASKAAEKREYEFQGEFQSRAIDLKTDVIGHLGQMAQNDINMTQTIASNNISAAQQAQSAAISMANEIGGIYGDLAKEGKQIGFKAYANANEVAYSAPFDIKNTAYKAADMAIDTAFEIQKYKINAEYGEKAGDIAMERYKTQAGAAAATANIGNAAAVEQNRLSNKLEAYKMRKGYGLGLYEYDKDKWNKEYEKTRENVKDYTGAVSGLDFGISSGVTAKAYEYKDAGHYAELAAKDAYLRIQQSNLKQNTLLEEITTNRAIAENQLQAQIKSASVQLGATYREGQLSLKKAQQDTAKAIETAALEAAKQIAKAQMKMAQGVNDAFLKAETAAFTMGREMGLTGQRLRDYSKEMSLTQMKVAKWGKDLEWIQKTQSAYQETTGRNKELSTQDLETSAAFGHIVGDDTIAEYTSGMEIFNHSVEDSNEKLYTMFKEVSKIGLNGKKYAKELAKNLKLAEKYNFKGGVEGLMKMSKWAQNMRFNMGSLDGMLDNVQEGGLEGVIKQAAELQVLGGNFAMGSDPMAMAYESYMDPEAYAKRMNSMIAGQGFLKENGEVGFGIASQQMMRQYAKSSGQDYKDVLNQARAQVKLGAIESNLNGNFTDDQKSLIANKAEYKDGEWKVNTGLKDVEGNSIMKSVSELTAADVKNLEMQDPEDVDKAMLEQLNSIYASEEEMKNMQTTAMTYMEGASWDKLRETNQGIIDKVKTEFFENFDKYKTALNGSLNTMSESMNTYYDLWKEGEPEIDEKVNAIKTSVTRMEADLGEVKQSSQEYLDKLNNIVIPQFSIQAGHIQQGIDDILKALKQEIDHGEKVKGYEKLYEGKNASQITGSIKNRQNYLSFADREGWIKVHGKVLKKGTEEFDKWHDNEEAMIEGAQNMLKQLKVSSNSSSRDTRMDDALTMAMDGKIENNGHLSKINDGKIENNGHPIRKINDGPIDENGLVVQNGIPTLIDKNDQVLAAKNGGPLDRLLDMAIEPMRAAQRAEEEYKRAMEGIKEERENVRQRLIIEAVQASSQLGNTNPSNNAKLLNQLVSGGGFLKENGEVGFGISTQMMMRQFADVTGQDYEDVLNEAREMVREAYYDPEKLMKRLGTSSSNDWESILTKTNSESSRTDVTTVQQHQNSSSNWADVSPRSMPYDSYVKENPYSGSSNNNNSNSGRIEIPPIQININGSIQLSGGSGNVDITQQIANDPNFIRSLSQLISMEVEKKVRGGRVINPLNRGLEW